jgi:uncharacterized NAD(P)/FAD-binding protein YdhS
MTRHSIVIIGGGVAGSLLAVQLTRLPGGPWPLDVVLVEPRPAPGPGTAYSNDRPEWLLNVRSGNLSALPSEPDHFVNWLRQQGMAADPNAYYPRQTYGRYIQSLTQQALSAPAANGVRVQWLQQRAVTAAPDVLGQQMLVGLENGSSLQADAVVLALGNFPPAMPVRPADDYCSHPCFHGNPWLPNALRSINPDEKVLLIGTGLTALDALVGLHKDGHRGQILAVSRHGRWPAAHLPVPALAYPNYYATDLAGLQTVAEVLHVVRGHVSRAGAAGYNWRAVLDALRPDLGHIWATWPLAEQRRFLRQVATIWSTQRHRNPPHNAAILDELLASGQLQVHQGSVSRIEPRGTGQLAVQLRHAEHAHWLTADHVVLCTGPQMNYEHLTEPLVVNLRQQGLLVPDGLRLGISTDAVGALRDASGQVSKQLFTLGPSLRPLWFESTAVPEIRQQAADLAAVLAHRLAGAGEQHITALQSAP